MRAVEGNNFQLTPIDPNFRNLFGQTPEMVCVLKGPDHVFEYVNEAHVKVLGFDATGKSVREAQPESVEVHGILDDVYRTGETAFLREIPVTVGDRLRYFNLTYAARRDESGRVNGIMILGVEISDQILNREKLKQAVKTLAQVNEVSRKISGELELKDLVQSITDAGTQLSKAQFGAFFYNLVDADGESYTLYTISGVPREEFSKFPMPRNTDVFAPTFAGTGTVRSDDITADSRYGKNAPYNGMPKGHLPVRSYLAVPVISRSGNVLGGLFFGHSDVGRFTDREEKIVEGIASHAAVAIDNARLYKLSQDAVRARDQFMSICSHELKTPITSLKLQAQLAKRKLLNKTEVDLAFVNNLADSMEQQLNQLAKLVEDMLDIARIETGKLSFAKEHVDLSDITKRAAERFAPQARVAGVGVKVDTDGPIWIEADPDRITQVITNLLSNALKYGNKKPIEVVAWTEGDLAKCRVVDQGIGISEKDRGKIFERFERLVPHNNISGLGLGLFISRQIVEHHGGRILVQSKPGEGATFTLEFPLVAGGKGK